MCAKTPPPFKLRNKDSNTASQLKVKLPPRTTEPTDHDWSSFCLKVVLKLSRFFAYLTSSWDGDDLAIDLKHAAQAKADFHTTDPFGRTHKLLRLVTHINQGLSNRRKKSSDWLKELPFQWFISIMSRYECSSPVGSGDEKALASECMIEAWTRRRWFEMTCKHIPNRCRWNYPACSESRCSFLEPVTVFHFELDKYNTVNSRIRLGDWEA